MAFYPINISSQTKKSKILSKSPNGYIIKMLFYWIRKKLYRKKIEIANTDVFENWIVTKISKQKLNQRTTAVRIIPVVVHVINKGEEVGTGTNISDTKLSLKLHLIMIIEKKSGTRGYNTNPVGADANIEFALQ